MSELANRTPTAELAASLNVSDECYELAAARYRDLGEWLNDRAYSVVARFKPHVFSQGSFRLGIVVKPLEGEDYDLDLACAFEEGISPLTHSQKTLKDLLGVDLEAYRKARNIKERLEPRHRCWRLNYQDTVGFHIDTVPGVRFDLPVRKQLRESMVRGGLEDQLARTIAENALAITDDRHPAYSVVSPNWDISNPEGYALWFESRMRQARKFLEAQVRFFKVASVEKLPVYRWRTPLQQALQMLKRHRDIMFRADPEGKPISIIITTLAAWSYRGESTIEETIDRVLSDMDRHINPGRPRVPNPVNPIEDFADKWSTTDGRIRRLGENFHSWLARARADFAQVAKSKDHQLLRENSLQKFGVKIPEPAPRRTAGPAIITSSSSAA